MATQINNEERLKQYIDSIKQYSRPTPSIWTRHKIWIVLFAIAAIIFASWIYKRWEFSSNCFRVRPLQVAALVGGEEKFEVLSRCRSEENFLQILRVTSHGNIEPILRTQLSQEEIPQIVTILSEKDRKHPDHGVLILVTPSPQLFSFIDKNLTLKSNQKQEIEQMMEQTFSIKQRENIRWYYKTFEIIEDRFVDNRNGTVTDKKLGLMWAKESTNLDFNWYEAKTYCQNYKKAGYDDWRLPAIEEIEDLYHKQKGYKPYGREHIILQIHTDPVIRLHSYWIWTSKRQGTSAFFTDFSLRDNVRTQLIPAISRTQILPVRTLSKD